MPPAICGVSVIFRPERGVYGLSTVLCTMEGLIVLSRRLPRSPKKNGSKTGAPLPVVGRRLAVEFDHDPGLKPGVALLQIEPGLSTSGRPSILMIWYE